jgi:putative ABC transport system permease protein
MTLLWIVGRSLRQHALSSVVTVLVCALASGLVLSVFSLERQARAAFTSDVGFDAVLGARGSELQLVLNAVFHLETSPGNIPWTLYEEIAATPGVELAVPYAVGDNYAGFRLVGTSDTLFNEWTFGDDKSLAVVAPGTFFDSTRAEAVVGSQAARATGLKLGSTFEPIHGFSADSQYVHQTTYTVVGVLEPTGTPIDRVIFIPIEGIFRMDGHVLRGTGEDYRPDATTEIPDEHKEVSAVLMKLSSPRRARTLSEQINRQGTVATLAAPISGVMADIFDKLGRAVDVLRAVAFLVIFEGALSILAALWNTMNERRREFAILRALGARRRTVFSAIVLEASAIAVIGAALGYLLYGLVGLAAAAYLKNEVGVLLEVFVWQPVFAWVLPGAALLGIAAGILPAARAYATEVAENLRPTS